MDYFQGLTFESTQVTSHGHSDEGGKSKRFLENLKSFSNKEWWGMPRLLFPNMCSLYGWKCTRQNCLTCSRCGASLLIRLPPADSEQYLVEVSRHFELLSTKHESTCSYKESPMPQNLLFMPVIPAEECLSYVLSEFQTGKHEEIPVIFSPNFEDRLEEYDYLVDWLIRKSSSDPSRNDKKVMLLILSGWRIRRKQKIECDQCFRLLGLWNYLCDTEPEPKRLTLSECLAQRDEFVREFSQPQPAVECPALDAERSSDGEDNGESGSVEETQEEREGKNDEALSTERIEIGEKEGIGSEGSEDMPKSAADKDEFVKENVRTEEGTPNAQLESGGAAEKDSGVESLKKLEIQSAKRQRSTEEKKKLDPLAEHFPWCRYIFVGVDEDSKEVQPSWLQRLQLLKELMIQEGCQRRSGGLVSVATLLDSALHPNGQT